MLKRLLLSFLIIFAPNLAVAQSTVLNGGAWTSGLGLQYLNSGSTGNPVVGSAGTAAGGATGVGLKELLVVARGTGTAPYEGQGTGPNGEIFCTYDGPTTGQNHYLCFSPNVNNKALISVGAQGGASAQGLAFLIDGDTINFPDDIPVIPSPYTSGAVVYASSTSALGFSALLTANQVVRGGGAGSPPATFAGTSGGIPYFGSSGELLSSAALTANAPVIGGGAGTTPSVGSRSGSTTTFATTSGSLGSGNCARFDASGNIVDQGSPCGASSGVTIGSTTVTSGTNTRILYDNSGILGEYAISGTGNVAMTTSPSFTTPSLGAATATSINNLTITAPVTPSTLTIAASSSLITSGANAVTLTSTGATNVTLPTTGTLATLAGSEVLTNKTINGPDNTLTNIALTSLATQAANTFVANATAGAAAPTASVALSAAQLAGRGSTGDLAAITLGTGLSMSGTTLNGTTGGFTVETAQATTSGNTKTFTGLTGAKVIRIELDAVSTNGTGAITVQIGSGSLTATGYVGAGRHFNDSGGGTTGFAFSTAFILLTTVVAGDTYSGSMTLSLLDSSNNIWAIDGQLGSNQGPASSISGSMFAGKVALAGALDRVALITANTFDAGSVGVTYSQ